MHTFQNMSTRENQAVLLMITNSEKWRYLPAQKLSMLLRWITSKYDGDFYNLNCFHSFRTENKLKKHENVCKNHQYCYPEMTEKDKSILKYNHKKKFTKVLFVCADTLTEQPHIFWSNKYYFNFCFFVS